MWWRIYYTDGSVFTNGQGTPFDAPRTGVAAIAEEDDDCGYVIVHRHDYYYWEPQVGGWCTSDLIGAFDHLMRAKCPLLLVGRMMAAKEYYALLDRIHKECGVKSGWRDWERRE